MSGGRVAIVVLVVALCGCSHIERGSSSQAVIVRVDCEHRAMGEDCRTLLQYTDSCERFRMEGTWGSLGDKLCVRRIWLYEWPRDGQLVGYEAAK